MADRCGLVCTKEEVFLVSPSISGVRGHLLACLSYHTVLLVDGSQVGSVHLFIHQRANKQCLTELHVDVLLLLLLLLFCSYWPPDVRQWCCTVPLTAVGDSASRKRPREDVFVWNFKCCLEDATGEGRGISRVLLGLLQPVLSF
jgi:hypothetical protein